MESVEQSLNSVENTVNPPPVPTEQPSEQPTQQQTKEVNLTDVNITNENVALNVLVGFVNVAQKRGAFNMQESSKIWEAIQQFMKKQ